MAVDSRQTAGTFADSDYSWNAKAAVEFFDCRHCFHVLLNAQIMCPLLEPHLPNPRVGKCGKMIRRSDRLEHVAPLAARPANPSLHVSPSFLLS